MRITLRYVAQNSVPLPDGWTLVGYVDGEILAYDPERRPHALAEGGPVALDLTEVNQTLVAAVDEAGLRVWPGGWTHAMPHAFGMNRRTAQRDRIERNGLHPGILRALGDLASDPDAAGIGSVLSALAAYADQYGGSGVQEALNDAERTAANAIAVLRRVRRDPTLKNRDGGLA